MLSSTTCERGIRAAPSRPCSRRNATICGRFAAIPQSTEAAVKPATAVSSRTLIPTRRASQPLSGVQTPPAFKVSDAPIPAMKETLPLMQQGAVWEVVVPPGKGAGDQNQQFAQQAIAIQIELGSVK